MSDDDIIQAAADVYIDLGGGGGRWVGREIAAAVVAAVRPLILAPFCTCESAFCDEFCQACEVVFDGGVCLRDESRHDPDAVGVGGQHTDTPPAGLVEWLKDEQHRRCCYCTREGDGRACDCKFYNPLRGEHQGSEQTGCPEIRAAIWELTGTTATLGAGTPEANDDN